MSVPTLSHDLLDHWGLNPFPEGSRAHQYWGDANRWIQEHLALFQSEVWENRPPAEASARESLDHLLKTLAGTFDIIAGGWSRFAPLTDDAAEAFKQMLNELEKGMMAGSFHLDLIPQRMLSSELQGRLIQRKLYWTGQMLRAVREHKNANRGKLATSDQKAAQEQPTESSPDAMLDSREERLRAFMGSHPGYTLADICHSAQVHKPDFADWRTEKLAQTSVMSQRIEDVLAGRRRLEKKPRPHQLD